MFRPRKNARPDVERKCSAADIPLEVVFNVIFPFVDAPFSCSPVSLVNARTYLSAQRCRGRHQKFGSRIWCEQQYPQQHRLVSYVADITRRHDDRPRSLSPSANSLFFKDMIPYCEDNVFCYHFPQREEPPHDALNFARELLSETSFDILGACCNGNGVLIGSRAMPAMPVYPLKIQRRSRRVTSKQKQNQKKIHTPRLLG